jgi:excinuclease ABC subunit C
LASNEEFDIFAIGVSEERGVVVKLFMRSGRIISSDFSYFNSSEIYDENDAYKQLLLSFYQADMPNVCKNILLPSEIEDTKEIENTLSKRFGFKINISTPKIGDKLRLTTLATTNAAELLKQKSNISTQPIEEKIASLLELSRTPYRVEIFDNSHHGGDATVGGMVVWSDGVWDKNSYRRYSLEAKDEYAQMREVLGRRIANFGFESPPDLWVLDGGATLLKLAISLLRDAGVNLDVIAISKEKLDAKANRAKGSARDIVYSINEKFNLQPTDKRLQWIQKLRDEAHRYAIAFHRAKKRKVMIQSKLLEEKGVGKALIIKLLNHFGTFEAIDNASLENLSEVVSEKIAYIIKNRTP